MQKFLCIGVVVLIGLSATIMSGETNEEEKGDSGTTRLAFIDMALVFKEYDKFNALRDGLKGEIAEADVEMKNLQAKASVLSQELKQLTPGTEEAKEKQREIATLKVDADAFGAESKRKFMNTEAGIYKQVYLEVRDEVARVAEDRSYTCVMRFDGSPLQEATDPHEILKGMNKQVIYMKPRLNITDEVVKRLNKKYNSSREI